MGTAVEFKRPRASPKVVRDLIRMGYLRHAKRDDGDAIDDALDELMSDLCRSETITDEPPKSA